MAPAPGICQHRRRHDTREPAAGAARSLVPTGGSFGGVTVRQATGADVEQMAAQLCRAFADDPVMAYVFRNEGRRTKAMRTYFTSQMRGDYLPFGGCYTTDDHLGAAVWGPPGKPLLTGIGRPQEPGQGHALCHLPCQDHAGHDQPDRIEASARAPLVSRHLGDRSRAQGRGIGSALMRPVLDHCDAEGWPAYLESSKERNIPFYARHGFAVVEEVPLPHGGPSIWTMWRAPQGPPAA